MPVSMGCIITVLVGWLVLCPVSAVSQEFKPYPRSEVTREQWQSYFELVKGKFGKTGFISPKKDLFLFRDGPTLTTYAFTTDRHPAHPAWITRQIVNEDGTFHIRMIGYFAGKEEAFAKLYKQYEKLNDRMRRELRRKKK